jgi:hypothetical protein
VDRKSPHTEAIFDDHDDGASEQIVGDVDESVENRSDLIVWIMISPQQDGTRQAESIASEKLPEVGVSRDDDS